MPIFCWVDKRFVGYWRNVYGISQACASDRAKKNSGGFPSESLNRIVKMLGSLMRVVH